MHTTLNEAFDYQPDGTLVWKKTPRTDRIGKPFGYLDPTIGYRVGWLHGKRAYAHRLVWSLYNGPIPDGFEIDHINGDRADNRIENLRCVSRARNHRNTKRNWNNSSGTTGVYYSSSKQRWCAEIMKDGKRQHIGFFVSLEDAVRARKRAERAFDFHPNHGRAA
jgi:hypothetical protein